MTIREQVEAEAAELYPVRDWDPYHQEPVETYGYEECQQKAHVRAKTVSAEQVEAAAKTAYEYERAETGNRWPAWADAPQEHEPMRKLIRAAFSVAGFQVEGDDDE